MIGGDVVGLELEGGGKIVNRFAVFPLVVLGPAALIIGLFRIRLQLNGVIGVLDGLVVFAHFVVGPGHVDIGHGVFGIELGGALQVSKGRGKVPFLDPRVG